MKKLLYILLCMAMTLVLFACAANENIAENSSSEAEQTAEPTPEPQAGERYDRHRERVTCRVDENEKDTKDTWKVKSPTESPDPSWVIEATEGDIITYSKTYCDHVKCIKTIEVPCPYNPEETHKERYYIMLEETANYGDVSKSWEVISTENGIVTYKSPAECNDSIHRFVRCDDMDEHIPCPLCPVESGLWDRKSYLKVPVSLEDREKPGEGYTYEYTEGDWEYYSRITCFEQHEAYAAAYAALAENTEG